MVPLLRPVKLGSPGPRTDRPMGLKSYLDSLPLWKALAIVALLIVAAIGAAALGLAVWFAHVWPKD